jgi:hypothetical protein
VKKGDVTREARIWPEQEGQDKEDKAEEQKNPNSGAKPKATSNQYHASKPKYPKACGKVSCWGSPIAPDGTPQAGRCRRKDQGGKQNPEAIKNFDHDALYFVYMARTFSGRARCLSASAATP